jgi:hypothetical protein
MNKALKKTRPCAYCGRPLGATDDHVIARQFFPDEFKYRDGLPKVPACPDCNTAKQRAEDGPAVLFQFGHSSDASRKVLLTDVRRRLAGNRRLHRSLRQGLKSVLVKQPGGLLVPSLGVNLDQPLLSNMWAWFRYVAQGLYRFEVGSVLPADHTIHIVRPTTPGHFRILRDVIFSDPNRQGREHALGELRYLYGRKDAEQVTMWLLAFKSIDMFWITAGPLAASVRADVARIEWTRPASSGTSTEPDSTEDARRKF